MKLKFQRKYLPILAEFAGVDDVRYYLNGFHIKPHSQGGVILTATNGHVTVTIHDKLGESDGAYILPISKALKSAAKKKTMSNRLELNAFQVIGNRAYLYHAADEFGYLIDAPDYSVECLVAHTEYISAIDGRYPDMGRLFKNAEIKAVEQIGLNPDYLHKLKHLSINPRLPHIRMIFSGANGCLFSIGGVEGEIAAMIMPANLRDLDHDMSFAFEAGNSDIVTNKKLKVVENV